MEDPKKPKSKEEIVFDLKRKQSIERKRKLLVDKFFPALIKATISVEEAKSLISAMSSLIMEETLKKMNEMQFSDIKENVIKRLCEDGERLPEITALTSALDGENLYVSREIIEGMTNAIAQMVTDEMKGRKLDSLKVDWDRYLNPNGK